MTTAIQAEQILPVPPSKLIEFQIDAYCGNIYIKEEEIDKCVKFQTKEYGTASILETMFSISIPGWEDVVQRCWNNAFSPNLRSMEKFLLCLQKESRAALKQ